MAGAQLGRLLEETTRRALGNEPGVDPAQDLVLPASITGAQAGELLPNLQRAVLLAVAATERYERVGVEPGERPADVLCVDCNQGSTFHQVVTISEKCSQYGHTPFGYPTGTTWDQAQRRAGAAQRRWESEHPQG